ncbi:TPA: hypothetical protein U5D81_001524 [Yersinia enterocolitica]|nr:hypothetical protein [Yersinia enterocolitica]HEN3367468.1 hypothetical protein [Yersinia enterocolitica]HEN3400495.1 hypothetical protein [Yersinia enterocolitica]HEN3422610.1 hypothetical protein [Yersinia enterocolitica]
MKVKVVSSSEASYLLRIKLGNIRAWEDVLADMRRGRSSYHGLTLKPFCKCLGSGMHRPVYQLSEIQEFIEKALRLRPALAKPYLLSICEIEIDPTDKRHWSIRKIPTII